MIFFTNLRLVLLIRFWTNSLFDPWSYVTHCKVILTSHVSSFDRSIIGQILVCQMAYGHRVCHMAYAHSKVCHVAYAHSKVCHMAITFSTWHMAITFAMWPTTCIYLSTIYAPTYRLNRSTYLPM
jgi:hypothetical protein